MHHELRPCGVGIGLGSPDLGVAIIATHLYHHVVPAAGLHRRQRPKDIERFPHGEAVHYAEYAIEHGAPADSRARRARRDERAAR
ncbi:hypothetical protein Dfulv_00150 [Dactylosporangium fulvum]|uniref:Uncharacterized protein n=1 Tax=Dactylosporangium fulvum TaxID=53359 RepID=A0ABY5VY92_9ACTN|nr:hypothetical protein [Dactylosporangium fulvum]UWP82778.1 hypothetical protein Dfulv_00150 [Dactylosporangium fulvum]